MIDVLKSLLIPDSWMKAEPCDILFFQADADLGEEYLGLPFGRLLGPAAIYAETNGFKYVFLSRPYSLLTGNAAWAKPLSMNRVFFVHHVLIKIGAKNLARKYIHNRTIKFLSKARPKVIFTIGATDWLCSASNFLTIPVVETLHGTGYINIPWGWGNLETASLPTHIISYDDRSKSTFSKLEDKGVSILRLKDSWPGFVSSETQNLLGEVINTPAAEKIVLVTLQWGYSGESKATKHLNGILSNGLIPDLLIDIASESDESTLWKFRLHPVQLRGGRYKEHREIIKNLCERKDNFEWNIASHAPLPEVMKKVTHHITMSSMSVYQAADLGIPSLVLCPSLLQGGHDQDLFNDLVEEGFVQKTGLNSSYVKNWLQTQGRNLEPIDRELDSDLPEIASVINQFVRNNSSEENSKD